MNRDGSVYDEIITYIQRNRVSTTEVADCMGKMGALENVMPLNRRKFAAGRIFYTYAIEDSNWNIHEDIRYLKEDDILFIDAIDVNGRAIVGDLVSKYVLLYKKGQAIVTNGKMRDAHTLIKEDYSIWCSGVSPVGSFNRRTNGEGYKKIIEERRDFYQDAIAVCDDSGVVIIPKENINEDFVEKLKFIEKQEDIWYDCLDRRKMNTYDIVCLKKYSDE